MGRKIFVSYKYSDASVNDLGIYSKDFFGNLIKVTTTARHYVDRLTKILDDEDHIYKGENDGTSLADFSEDYITTALKEKIYDSSITIVLISQGMKSYSEIESNQWIPWEISYSLRQAVRNGRVSGANGIIAVVLPDNMGNYTYYLTPNVVCKCVSYNTGFLFKILRDNMFNQKYPVTTDCENGSVVYHGDFSYIQSVLWKDFIINPNFYLDKAIEIRDNIELYNIVKTP